jgi:hypothetical protein
MLDVVVKMTPEELKTLMSSAGRMGKYSQLIFVQDRTLTEIGAEGGTVGAIEEGSEDTGELLAALYTACARTFGEYPGNVRIASGTMSERLAGEEA